jgi:hypothetical protein
MKIAIDPGHGMSNRSLNVFDPGATHTEAGTVFREADIALKYGLALKDVFRARGQDVFMTRDDDTDHAAVTGRAGNAEKAGCEVFISLHLNDAEVDSANGLEVLYRGDDDEPLARSLQDALIKATGFRDRGIKLRTDLAVLKFNGRAVLIELGFIANDSDRTALLNPATRESICETIANVLLGPVGGASASGGAASVLPLSERGVINSPDGEANVRSGPAQSHEIIAVLRNGDPVEIHASSGRWRRIAPSQDQWVHGSLIAPTSETSAEDAITRISQIAATSSIAKFNWPERGRAPIGYTKGMAVAFARLLCKLRANDPVAVEMAKSAAGTQKNDCLAHYRKQFEDLGMDNSVAGADTLRHLFVLMLGLGMRESSGRHCCGRDTSAGNTNGNTAEAGLFQTSWNARSLHPLMEPLFEHYRAHPQTGFLEIFSDGVTCNQADWQDHGAGNGRIYQGLAKKCPAFHLEFTGLAMRNTSRHWGPIINRAALLKDTANQMFRGVQDFVEKNDVCPV